MAVLVGQIHHMEDPHPSRGIHLSDHLKVMLGLPVGVAHVDRRHHARPPLHRRGRLGMEHGVQRILVRDAVSVRAASELDRHTKTVAPYCGTTGVRVAEADDDGETNAADAAGA